MSEASNHIETIIKSLGDRFSVPALPLTGEFAELCAVNGQQELYLWFAQQINKQNSIPDSHRNVVIYQMKQKSRLNNLFNLLESNQIPFVPIKGIDLAFRIYPIPALRLFGDWDIWVQKKDLSRFCDLLKKNNWSCQLDSWSDHHCGMYSDGTHIIEPHFSLPNFTNIAQNELWEQTIQVTGKTCERHLSNELNLIMLLRHSLLDRQHCDILKLLLDVEFLLQQPNFDWNKVSMLCKKWRIAHPGLLLEAFPDFFQQRHCCGMKFSQEQTCALRELLLNSGVNNDKDEIYFRANTAPLLNYKWLTTQLLHLRRDNLRWNYPEIGNSYTKYLLVLVYDIFRKIFLYIYAKYHKNSNIKKLITNENIVESSWKN